MPAKSPSGKTVKGLLSKSLKVRKGDGIGTNANEEQRAFSVSQASFILSTPKHFKQPQNIYGTVVSMGCVSLISHSMVVHQHSALSRPNPSTRKFDALFACSTFGFGLSRGARGWVGLLSANVHFVIR